MMYIIIKSQWNSRRPVSSLFLLRTTRDPLHDCHTEGEMERIQLTPGVLLDKQIARKIFIRILLTSADNFLKILFKVHSVTYQMPTLFYKKHVISGLHTNNLVWRWDPLDPPKSDPDCLDHPTHFQPRYLCICLLTHLYNHSVLLLTFKMLPSMASTVSTMCSLTVVHDMSCNCY